MKEIDSEISCDPKRLSRIYRDARYSKGQSVFRDYIWYSFGRTRENATSLPGFYFSISPKGFDYGCGYYYMPTTTMAAVRKLILSGDHSFIAANEAYKKQNIFTLGGDLYKRDHYSDEPEENKLWLNRRNIFLFAESNDFQILYGKDLLKKSERNLNKYHQFTAFS